eukprot:11149335-Lingulodinium_polyedra.AAC.1
MLVFSIRWPHAEQCAHPAQKTQCLHCVRNLVLYDIVERLTHRLDTCRGRARALRAKRRGRRTRGRRVAAVQ